MVRLPGSRRFTRLVAVLLPLLALTLASAAPGDLDTTFNSDGLFQLDAGAPGTPDTNDVGVGLVIVSGGPSSGRIVIAVDSSECTLIGLTPAGILDPGFGTGGRVVIPASDCGRPVGIALQKDASGDEKIILAAAVDFKLAVSRYSVDGVLDESFGDTLTTPGVAHTEFAGGQLSPGAVAVQTDDSLADFGRIVVVGHFTASPGPSTSDIALAVYSPDGALDTSFDGDGLVLKGLAVDQDEFVHAVAFQGSKIVVGGGRGYVDPAMSTHPFVARFTDAGALDTTFNGTGWVTTSFQDLLPPTGTRFGGNVTALVIQDGKIVAVGTYETNLPGGSNTDTPVLARYNDDGSPDGTFGTGGRATGPAGSAAIGAVLQDDGQIVVSGFFDPTPAVNTDAAWFGVARFSHDGELDTSFGNGGVVPTDFGFGEFGNAFAVGIQADRKIVAAGYLVVPNSSEADLAVARYLPDGAAGDTTPPSITSITATPRALWPPLHQMVTVNLTVDAADDSGVPPTCKITEIQSNQPDDAPGPWDGNTTSDYVIVGPTAPLRARLRAEISLIMGRRTYTLTVECKDAAGNATTGTVPVVATLLPPALLGF